MVARVVFVAFVLGVPAASCCIEACSAEPEPIAERKFTVSDVNQGKQFANALCSRCHGRDARGAKGPDLTDADFIHAQTDQEIIDVIANGIPGTGMIGFGVGFDDYYWPIVAYIRDEQKRRKAAARPPMGNIARGYELFKKNNCTSCHWVDGDGGRLGTNLTGHTATAEYIRESLRDPNSQIDGTYQSVQVMDVAGRSISGRRLDENSYSILLMDPQENFHIVDKTEAGILIKRPNISIMPDFKDKLSDQDIEDITTYVYSLRKVKPR